MFAHLQNLGEPLIETNFIIKLHHFLPLKSNVLDLDFLCLLNGENHCFKGKIYHLLSFPQILFSQENLTRQLSTSRCQWQECLKVFAIYWQTSPD